MGVCLATYALLVAVAWIGSGTQLIYRGATYQIFGGLTHPSVGGSLSRTRWTDISFIHVFKSPGDGGGFASYVIVLK